MDKKLEKENRKKVEKANKVQKWSEMIDSCKRNGSQSGHAEDKARK